MNLTVLAASQPLDPNPTGGYIAMMVLVPIALIVVAAILAFVIAQKRLKKEIATKPPINRAQIIILYEQTMGRHPSEQQIMMVMNGIRQSGGK
ncbi:hypothetical protein FACS1894218_3810 [Bacilli bacterium]|nr:hypothetical protein FACS1894218_3810 [Bacilli bacterium]